jgi:hypothetical protein
MPDQHSQAALHALSAGIALAMQYNAEIETLNMASCPLDERYAASHTYVQGESSMAQHAYANGNNAIH